MSDSGQNLAYLAFCMYYEAGGEPIDGKIAVGHVILNRARERHLSVARVVMQSSQFEWYTPGMTFKVPEVRIPEFTECIIAVQRLAAEVLDGENLRGANHFFNPKLVKPYWADDMVLITKIGNHVFYKG